MMISSTKKYLDIQKNIYLRYNNEIMYYVIYCSVSMI